MAEAKLNREYALRIAGIGVLMVGMCVWSVYDGQVGWPRQNAAMESVRPLLLSTNMTAEAWVAHEAGEASPLEGAFVRQGLQPPAKLVKKVSDLRLPGSSVGKAGAWRAQAGQLRKLFESPVYSKHDLASQFIQALITLALGGAAFVSLGLKAGKRFTADDKGLGGKGFRDQVIPYREIDRIDWGKWDEKGIVALTLKSGETFKLDGWHFSGMREIVETIRRQRPELAADAGTIPAAGTKGAEEPV